MRPTLLLLFLLLVSGCLAGNPPPDAQRPARVAAESVVNGVPGAALNDEYVYEAPQIAGAWAAAFWIRTSETRICDLHLTGTGKPAGGTWDSLGVVAKGWARPEILGRFDHGFSRGDGYVAHAGSSAVNHTVRGPSAVPPLLDFEHRRRVDLPLEALLVIGNTYMAPPAPERPGLRVRLSCDGFFTILHVGETARLLSYGPEDFDGLFVADTAAGFGLQRGATKTLSAKEGFVVLLHEDGNHGNAEYTTVRPDGSQQVDSFGNRVIVGGAGAWRVNLNRVSPSPQGEFRLFALDLPVPDVSLL